MISNHRYDATVRGSCSRRPPQACLLVPCVFSRVDGLRSCFFFFNATATTEIYTLSLHDALPISAGEVFLPKAKALLRAAAQAAAETKAAAQPSKVTIGYTPGIIITPAVRQLRRQHPDADRKSTRLNSSHMSISYAVFCLKKKKKK